MYSTYAGKFKIHRMLDLEDVLTYAH
jgi:hypothetical protein